MRLNDVLSRFRDHGCRSVLVKELSPNDDPKHGIYVGPNLEPLNVLPHKGLRTEDKHPKADVALSWLSDDGAENEAPHAKLILYVRHREMRLSGFLLGCADAPSSILNDTDHPRVVVFGLASGGRMLGWVGAAGTDLLADLVAAEHRHEAERISVFRRFDLGGDSRTRLLRALGRLHERGWVRGQTLLGDGTTRYTNDQNAVGLTLEAALGIPKDAKARPDFEDWEIKGYSVRSLDSKAVSQRVTLMTPEPTGGLYGREGIVGFVRRYGYPPKTKSEADRLDYVGIHRVGEPARLTRPDDGVRMTLRLRGYESGGDGQVGRLLELNDGAIEIVDQTGLVAAAWPFPALLEHWVGKHALAVYVPAVKRLDEDGNKEFRFASEVRLGSGTDFVRFLAALDAHAVFYDPGMNVRFASSAKPKPHPRSQFRTTVKRLPDLYESFGIEEVT